MNTKLRIDTKSISWIGIFIALGVYLKEFYLMDSGSLQLGDICFIVAFFLSVIKSRITLSKIDYKLFAFVFLAILINIFYCLIYSDYSFLIYSSYLVFSVIIVLLTRSFYENKTILNYVLFSLKAAQLTQVAVSFVGGRYLFSRYTGTFNDPNQFGYYILTSFFLIYMIHHMLDTKMRIYWYVIPTYLVLLSQSSGMLLGLSVFAVVLLWNATKNIKNKWKWVLIAVLIIVVIFAFLLNIGDSTMSIDESAIQVSALRRMLKRMSTGNISLKGLVDTYIKDRSITRVIENPFALFYGAGEGRWERYAQGNEIHATMIAICFYYGIIPFIMWIGWIRDNVIRISNVYYCVVIASIVEACTLANHRQPFFWMIFVLSASLLCKKRVENSFCKK